MSDLPDLSRSNTATDDCPSPDCTCQYCEQVTENARLTAENEALREAIRKVKPALDAADAACRFHGTEFGAVDTWSGGPRCDSCKQPWRVVQARNAISGRDRVTRRARVVVVALVTPCPDEAER